MPTTGFWNKLHQVRSNIIRKPNYINVLGTKKTILHKQDRQNRLKLPIPERKYPVYVFLVYLPQDLHVLDGLSTLLTLSVPDKGCPRDTSFDFLLLTLSVPDKGCPRDTSLDFLLSWLWAYLIKVVPETVIGLSTLLTLSVPDKGCSRDTSCALIWMYTL